MIPVIHNVHRLRCGVRRQLVLTQYVGVGGTKRIDIWYFGTLVTRVLMRKEKTMALKTRVGYRDAGDGQSIKKSEAERLPPNQVVKERIPLPGRGDTKK